MRIIEFENRLPLNGKANYLNRRTVRKVLPGNDVSVSWQPSSRDAERDRMLLADRLDRSIAALVSHVAPSSSTKVQESISQLWDIRIGTVPAILHPEIFGWYYKMERIVVSRALHSLGSHLSELPLLPKYVIDSLQRAHRTESILNAPVDVTPRKTSISHVLDSAMENLSLIRNEFHSPVELVEEWSDEITHKVAESFSLIRRVWPELYLEICDSVRSLIVYSGSHVMSFCTFSYHGSCFICDERIAKDPIADVSARIVHEAAHVRMNSAFAVNPPVYQSDSAARFVSPMRSDPRPITGVLHQLFVLWRMSEFYLRAREDCPSITAQQSHNIDNKLRRAIEIADFHANLTPSGTGLLLDAKRFLATK